LAPSTFLVDFFHDSWKVQPPQPRLAGAHLRMAAQPLLPSALTPPRDWSYLPPTVLVRSSLAHSHKCSGFEPLVLPHDSLHSSNRRSSRNHTLGPFFTGDLGTMVSPFPILPRSPLDRPLIMTLGVFFVRLIGLPRPPTDCIRGFLVRRRLVWNAS